MENPDTLSEEHLWRTIFENIILIFWEFIVLEKFGKNENRDFASLNMQKI